MDIKDISDIASKWVTIIAAICGGLWALLMFHDKINTNKKEATLKYVEMYNSERLYKAKEVLQRCVKNKCNEINSAKPDNDKLYVVLANIVDDNESSSNIDTIVDFYDTLSTCVASGVCDETVAKKFFGKEAHSINGTLHPFFCEERRNTKDLSYAHSVEIFAKAYNSNQMLVNVQASFNGYSCPLKVPAGVKMVNVGR